jgi:hypothetical protein
VKTSFQLSSVTIWRTVEIKSSEQRSNPHVPAAFR